MIAKFKLSLHLLDLLKVKTCCLVSGPGRLEGEVNVLLVGSADPRHILKTVAGLQDAESLHVSRKNRV